eukprot:2596768-Amphidinium_carterae.1
MGRGGFKTIAQSSPNHLWRKKHSFRSGMAPYQSFRWQTHMPMDGWAARTVATEMMTLNVTKFMQILIDNSNHVLHIFNSTP